jgi:hypothetical protein
MRSLPLVLGIIFQLHTLAVTINIDADSLKDASGQSMTNGVIVLVADVKDFTGSGGNVVRNGFSGPTASSFSGTDFLVHRWNFSPGSPEYFGPGAFQAAVNIPLSGAWQAGDPLRLYWFPQNTAGDTAPGVGKPFGTYRSNSSEAGASGSFPWVTPAETATLSINGETASVPKESTISVAALTTDANTLAISGSGLTPASAGIANSAMVVGRWIFYNGSGWDSSAAAESSDDAAIALDKAPLFGGAIANFANYTSYTRGINGLMVDISNPANGAAIAASDFIFKSGNDNNPAGWTNAPAPLNVSRRLGAGINGSDRFTIIWTDNVIQKQWLQVTVLATANTGLSSPEIFYFGNAIGDTGNASAQAQVNVLDENAAHNNPKNVANPAGINDLYDFNRDKRVNALDENAAHNHATTVANALRLIALP